MLPEKPYALSCDRNSEPILTELKKLIDTQKTLFEIGAGTAQHAIFMAPHFPKLMWTVADQKERHEGISLWLNDFPRTNIRGPIEYSIGETPILGTYDVVFTANTIHIMEWELCLKMFDDIAEALEPEGQFLAYGAFKYDGKFTTESNERFDEWLKEKHPGAGVRDFEEVNRELQARGLKLDRDIAMPSNNQLLVFSKA